MVNVFTLIGMLGLATSQLLLLREYKHLKYKISRAEDRYLELVAITLRGKENGKETSII